METFSIFRKIGFVLFTQLPGFDGVFLRHIVGGPVRMFNETSLVVCVVDDDLFTLHLYQQYLLNMGISSVLSCSDTENLALNLKPDIIFLSDEIKGVDSIAVLEEIKKYDPDIYVVILSGKECIAASRQFYGKGAYEYLLKEKTDEPALKEIVNRIACIKKQLLSAK